MVEEKGGNGTEEEECGNRMEEEEGSGRMDEEGEGRRRVFWAFRIKVEQKLFCGG